MEGKIKACLKGIWIPAAVAMLLGCGQDLPFEYRYRSPNLVEVNFQGKTYQLNRFGPSAPTPFEFAFEPDGDVDIRIGGKTYDIDSPYDIDKPKKKKKKKKKKTTRKKTTKRQ